MIIGIPRAKGTGNCHQGVIRSAVCTGLMTGDRNIANEHCQAKMCLQSESEQSDQCLRCPLPESLDTIECINGEQRP